MHALQGHVGKHQGQLGDKGEHGPEPLLGVFQEAMGEAE